MRPTANESLMAPYAPLLRMSATFHDKRNQFTGIVIEVWN